MAAWKQSREEWAETRRVTLELLHGQLAERVSQMSSMESWQEWLGLAHSLHRYSFKNTLLILAQNPDATLVARFKVWQQKGRHVRKGERGIRVLAPVKKAIDLLDEDGQPVRDANGKTRQTWRIIGMKPVSVFDVSQVDPPIEPPPKPQLLTGQAPPGLWEAMSELAAIEGFTVTRGDCGTANGLINYADREIRIRDGIDDAQAVKTLAHELGHAFTMTPAEAASQGVGRELREVEAESVAYMVTAAHGLDSSQYTFDYVAGWAARAASKETSVEDVIVATGQRVIAAANRILSHTQPYPTLEDDLADAWIRAVQPTPTPSLEAATWETVPHADPRPVSAEQGAAVRQGERRSVGVPR